MKVLSLRRGDVCVVCSEPLPAGTRAEWDGTTRSVRCLPCSGRATGVPEASASPQPEGAPPVSAPATPNAAATPVAPTASAAPAAATVLPEVGRAGASAQSEYERRSRRREERIRARHPKLAGLILALSDDPTSTRAWAQGAAGERAVATKLEDLVPEHAEVLHDRSMRRPDGTISRANIDHIAIAATGVWVVDAKTHKGALEVRRSGGFLSPRVEELYIGGRKRSSLLEGLQRQVDAVQAALASVQADVPVRGALCFVGTELPWFGTSIRGVPLVGRRGLGKLLKRPGELGASDRASVAAFLSERFPPVV